MSDTAGDVSLSRTDSLRTSFTTLRNSFIHRVAMFHKLAGKSKKDKRQNSADSGAAVPYPGEQNGTRRPGQVAPEGGRASTVPVHYSGATRPDDSGLVARLGEAAAKADIDTIRQLIKGQNRVDINSKDTNGDTALHKAAAAGRSRTIRYLLLHGADMEATNKKGETALYVAVDYNNTSTVGVLLDYLHSVDHRPREPFVILRAKREKNNSYVPQRVGSCSELKPFQKRGMDVVQIMIAHGQQAQDMSIFLYSVLDVSVEHAFFMNITGEMNMKNFQRFESKAKSQSLTVLNTSLRVMDVTGYDQLRCLIVVSCDMVKLVLDGMPCLELLDVSYNKLDTLPEGVGKCLKLKTLRCAHNLLKRLPGQLGELKESLVELDCSYNLLKRLTSKLTACRKLKSLECDHNGIIELPVDIGVLKYLQVLRVHNNKLSQLPLSVASLENLKSISFQCNPLQNIPTDFPQRVTEVQQYLNALQDDPVPNKTIKLVLVGQEGVGKTTLLKALKRSFWMIPRTPTTPKTDGIDIKDIKLDDVTLRCFDCGGDVDFNETHTFFITQGALYLACFNIAEYCISTVERSSFLLGRLQLWLQYIFSKVPNAQVIIVGTHADHPSLTRKVFEEVWDQLRALLVKSRDHHHQYFKHSDKLGDCLLCQSDPRCLRRMSSSGDTGFVNMGFDDTISVDSDTESVDSQPGIVAFPHIVGYYEVSSIKSVGSSHPLKINSNVSMQHLKDAIKDLSKRLINKNQEMPRRWSNVQESLQNHVQLHPDNAIASLEEVAQIAKAQGIHDRPQLVNMLQFFKAQGNVLYFPQLDDLQNTVILDPEWLAKIFSSVISYRDTGFDEEGFIRQDVLRRIWRDKQLDGPMGAKVLTLLRHFGVCLPVSDNNKELFPCKLPIGEPDEDTWSISPQRGEQQVTHRITFPSIIPPPFFSNLLVTVYKARAPVRDDCQPSFYSNKIVDWLAVDTKGCKDCGASNTEAGDRNIHKVLFELIPHARAIQITTRGPSPCCVLAKTQKILNKVADQFEGLGTIDIDTIICPGCHMQISRDCHKYSIKHLRENLKKKDKIICRNAHIVPNAQSLLCGLVNDTCLPLATIRPKAARDKFDYSGCPKLFIMLPVNKDGMTFDKDLQLFTSSLIYDGYAAHFLCEFPDGYHVTKTPGYRLKDPKDFMRQFGVQVISVLQLLQHMSGSTVSPQYANQTNAVTRVIASLIAEYQQKFPACKTDSSGSGQDLQQQTVTRGSGIQREHLRKHLHVMDRPDAFGPLRRLKYGQSLVWLCNEHYRQLRVVTLGNTLNVQAHTESSA